MQVTSAEALVQSLSVDLFFYIIITTTNIRIYWNLSEFVRISLEYPYSNGFHWNLAGIYFPLEFHGIWLEFQWIPMETVPRGSRIPVVSIRFHWIPSDSIGIPTFRSESAGFHRNSWGKVKTSNPPPFLMIKGLFKSNIMLFNGPKETRGARVRDLEIFCIFCFHSKIL